MAGAFGRKALLGQPGASRAWRASMAAEPITASKVRAFFGFRPRDKANEARTQALPGMGTPGDGQGSSAVGVLAARRRIAYMRRSRYRRISVSVRPHIN